MPCISQPPAFKKIKALERFYLLTLITKAYVLLFDLDNNQTGEYGVVIMFIIAPLISGFWTRRIVKNNIILGAKNTWFTPNGSFAIAAFPILYPILLPSLFQELWKSSHDPANWKTRKKSQLVQLWQVIIVLSLFVFFVVGPTIPDGSIYRAELFVYSLLPIWYLSVVMEVIIVVLITRAQYAYSSKLAAMPK